MGTRADFYIQTKTKLEYLGSIGWDGYPSGIDFSVLYAKKASEYRDEVKKFLGNREDASLPKRDGWPWPWETSKTTDYAYVFIAGAVYASNFGSPLFNASEASCIAGDIDAVSRLLRKFSKELNSKTVTALTELQEGLQDKAEELQSTGLCLDFPDMTKIQKVSVGRNSGLIVVGGVQ